MYPSICKKRDKCIFDHDVKKKNNTIPIEK